MYKIDSTTYSNVLKLLQTTWSGNRDWQDTTVIVYSYQRYYDVTIDTNEAIIYPGIDSDWINKLPSELDWQSILQQGNNEIKIRNKKYNPW